MVWFLGAPEDFPVDEDGGEGEVDEGIENHLTSVARTVPSLFSRQLEAHARTHLF